VHCAPEVRALMPNKIKVLKELLFMANTTIQGHFKYKSNLPIAVLCGQGKGKNRGALGELGERKTGNMFLQG
jgi:hypothetical protein